MYNYIESGKKVLDTEAQAINSIAKRLDHSFVNACQAILNCKGHVILIGIGKSGHIAKKISATLSSTGSPSFFVHPAEALHGDLGMITANDLIIFISKSGETEEIITFIPILKRLGNKFINIGEINSTISRSCDINIDVHIEREACVLNLAPTTCSTVALAIGDALAISVLQARGFTKNDFARVHPGGILGRRLLVKVSDIMHSGNDIPKVFIDTILSDVILEISNKRLGMTTVVDKQIPNKLIGLITDGDLRRLFSIRSDIQSIKTHEIMCHNPKTVYEDILAHQSILIMQQYKIHVLPVLNRKNKLIGALNIHDIFRAGIV